MAGPAENRVFIPVNNNNNNIRPTVGPPHQSGFMNFPNNQIPPFPLQNQFPNNNNNNINTQQQNYFSPPTVNNNQFNNNPSQQQMMMMMMMMMNPNMVFNPQNNVGNQQQQQVLVQNTIQNIRQLLQLQNQNQNQFGGNGNNNNGVMQHGNPFLPPPASSSSSVNFQNQIPIPIPIPPQNHNFYMPQMFGMMPNTNGPMMQQNVNNHGQPRFVSPIMDVNAIASTHIVQTQNSAPTITNLKDNNVTNVNGGWADSQHKNFTGHKTNDALNKRFKSHKHVKDKFASHNGNMSKAKANNNLTVNGPGNSTNFEMKLPSLKYTEQEIKQWREARKKHYPKSMTVEKEGKKEQTLSDVTNQAATLRRQQLKEVLAKQAELGLEVADIPSSYLSSPTRAHDKQNHRETKPERERYKKGKFQKKRGTRFQDNRNAKRRRQADEQKPKERGPSLLQKLLTRDIKRDKNHLLQVFRFMAANSFFDGETDNSLRFPSVIVRETNPQETETICSVSKGNDDKAEEEEEGEITD